jgi:hypothetical protein
MSHHVQTQHPPLSCSSATNKNSIKEYSFSILYFLYLIIHSIMVLKSAFLLAVSASLVLTAQAAPTMRNDPLHKRNSAEKEISKALLDKKVADCVAKSVGLGEDRSSTKYVEQVLACKNIANAQSGSQGMFFVPCENEVH